MSNPHVLFETSEGDILLELFADKAPKTVQNFLRYVDEGFYDGTIFHRVIRNFMNQGGGYTADLQPKEMHAPIENEAHNGVSNTAGTIAMARTPAKDSATSEFFINAKDNLSLDHRDETDAGYGYCVFGQVVEGIDVVKKITWKVVKPQGMHEAVPVDTVTLVSAARFEG